MLTGTVEETKLWRTKLLREEGGFVTKVDLGRWGAWRRDSGGR